MAGPEEESLRPLAGPPPPIDRLPLGVLGGAMVIADAAAAAAAAANASCTQWKTEKQTQLAYNTVV